MFTQISFRIGRCLILMRTLEEILYFNMMGYHPITLQRQDSETRKFSDDGLVVKVQRHGLPDHLT
jgi:hypothetical protein